MPNLETMSHLSVAYGPIVLFVIAVFLAFEALFAEIARRRRGRVEVNARLRLLALAGDGEAALVELRRNAG